MPEVPRSPQVVRFGVFEVDLRAGELRKQGLKIKLQEQSLQVLTLLLELPGQVVTREKLKEKLWTTGTHVDFDHGRREFFHHSRYRGRVCVEHCILCPVVVFVHRRVCRRS